MKNVPNNGPLAPPTVLTNVIPTRLNSAAALAGGSSPSSAASTAVIPRSMLVPWSASPMAASSWVSCSLFAAIKAANSRTHACKPSRVTASDMIRLPTEAPAC